MRNSVLFGLDYGTKRIGIATGQLGTRTATPLGQLKNDETFLREFAKLVKKWGPSAFVVGLPLSVDGTTNKQTQKVEHFCNLLKKHYTQPIHLIDECLSSKEAQHRLIDNAQALSKEAINATAAQIILETWFAEQSM